MIKIFFLIFLHSKNEISLYLYMQEKLITKLNKLKMKKWMIQKLMKIY